MATSEKAESSGQRLGHPERQVSLWRRRVVRRIALVVAVCIAGALAILVPKWIAAADDPTQRWAVDYDQGVGSTMLDGDRLLVADRTGLRALDVNDGSQLWSVADVTAVRHVAADGYLLVETQLPNSRGYAWISPDGDKLWETPYDVETSADQFDYYSFSSPSASTDGLLALFKYTLDARQVTGFAADGAPAWTRDAAFPSMYPITPSITPESPSPLSILRMIPMAAVIDVDDYLGTIQVLDPATGAVTFNGDVGPVIEEPGFGVHTPVFQLGSRIVTETAPINTDPNGNDGPALHQRQCNVRGRDADGSDAWDLQIACLYPDSVLASGYWIYQPFSDAFVAINAVTGDSLVLDQPVDLNIGMTPGVEFDSSQGGLALPAESPVFISQTDGVVSGLDVATKKQVWSLDLNEEEVQHTSLTRGVLMVSTDSDPDDDATTDPNGIGDGPTTVRMIDATTGELLSEFVSPSRVSEFFALSDTDFYAQTGGKLVRMSIE